MKKFKLVIIIASLLLTTLPSNIVKGVSLNDTAGNYSHFEAREAVNDVGSSRVVNELSINKYEFNVLDKLFDESEESRVEELKSSGYQILYDNNTETELFMYNETTGDMKILQFFDAKLVLDNGVYKLPEELIDTTVKRSGEVVVGEVVFNKVINEEERLEYSVGEVDFTYYLQEEDLRLIGHSNNSVAYESDSGLLVVFSVEYDNIKIDKRVLDSSIEESVEVREVVSNHEIKSDMYGYYVDTKDGEVRFLNTSAFYYIKSEESSPVDIFYDLDEETSMLLIKEMFNNIGDSSIEIGEGNELQIEYQIIDIKVPEGDRYFRGIRSNGENCIYPYGVDKNSDVNYCATEQYIRLGARNWAHYTTSYHEYQYIASTGFYEDKVDYKDYIENYHVDKTVVVNGEERNMKPVTINSAVLVLELDKVGGEDSIGDFLRRYETTATYEEIINQTKNKDGEVYFTLTVLEGEDIKAGSMSYDYYTSNLSSWSSIPASVGVAYNATTSININDEASSRHRFDITNAISKWTKEGYEDTQLIRIQSDTWDFYFDKDAFIELSVEEMPNFLDQDYELSETTVNLRAFTSNDQQGSVLTQGISVDGLTSYDARVKYEIYEKESGEVVHSGVAGNARETYTYPNYSHNIDSAQNYYRLESNYQSDEIISLKKFESNVLYGVRVLSKVGADTSGWIEGDTFQIYTVGYKFETLYRILNYYGRSSDELTAESKIDNNIINPLISEKNKLFIRNPLENAGKEYVGSNLDDSAKWLIDQSLMGMNLKCEYGFEPINFNNGNFYYTSTDGVVYDATSKVTIDRYYNAMKGGVDSSMGRNWSSIFDIKLQILENGSVAFADETGRVHTMSINSDSTFNASFGDGYTVEILTVGEYTAYVDNELYSPNDGESEKQEMVKVPMYNYVVTTSSSKYYFNDLLQLEKIVYSNNQSLEFEYNEYGVSKLTTDTGKELLVKYNSSGYVNEIIMPNNTSLKYDYDNSGNLIEFIDQEGVSLIYEYEDDTYLMSGYKLKDHDKYFIQNTYDSNNRVLTQIDANSSKATLEYFDTYTKVTDNEGNSKEIYFNEMGHTIKIVDNGSIVNYSYDSLGNKIAEHIVDETGKVISTEYSYDGFDLVGVKKPDGIVTSIEYDEHGNIVSSHNGYYETVFTYDDSNNLIKSSSEVEGVTTSTYNEAGYLISETNKYGGVTKYTYDEEMHLLKITTPTGETTYTYDANGSMMSKTNEFGGVYTYKRNDRGEIVETTDPYGDREYFEFNDFGHLVSKQDMNGVVTEYRYDDFGNLIEEIGLYGSTFYEYDKNFNLVKSIDEIGAVTNYVLDEKGMVVKVVYPNGNEVISEYDDFGNVISVRDDISVINTYEYDDLGLVTSSTNANGITTSYTYTKDSKILETKIDNVSTVKNTYNDYGELSSSLSANGVTTSYEYELGDMVSLSVGDIQVSSTSYNSTGNVEKVIDSLGNEALTYYTSEGLISKIVSKDGEVTEYSYDLMGRNVSVKHGDDVITTKEYYPLGQVKYEIDANGNKVEYLYDEGFRLVGLKDAQGNVYSYTLDVSGNILKETNPFGDFKTYTYDISGNKLSEVDEISRETIYEYDKRNRVIKITYFDKTIQEFKYDNLDNVIEVVNRGGIVTTYEYDSFGRVIKEEDSTGQFNVYEYDAIGNKVKESNHAGLSTTYEYDEFNNMIEMKTYDNNTTSYIYDTESRLVEVIDPLGNHTYTSYSPGGKVIEEISISGGVTKYSYDDRGREVLVVNALGYTTKRLYDKNSNVTTVIDALENTIVNEYDELNRVVKTTDQEGYTEKFYYDALGNIVVNEDKRGNRRSYEYDAASRQISMVDELGFKTSIYYDVNDNVISTVDPNNIVVKYKYDVHNNVIETVYGNNTSSKSSYDLRNNMIKSVDKSGNTTTYEYDDMNRMVKQTNPNGNELEYVYDEVGDLVEERDSFGILNSYEYNEVHNLVKKVDGYGLSETYTYCDCGGVVESITDSNGNTTFYEYDLLNQMTSQIDIRGNVTEFEYDALGNKVSLVINDTRIYNYEYDGKSQLIKEINPLNEESTTKYDEVGNVTSTTNALGYTSTIEYDAKNRSVKEVDYMGYETSNVYDATNLVIEVDGMGYETKYEYDEIGNVVKVEDAKGDVALYTYDSNDNLIYTSLNNTILQKYSYDSVGNVVKETNNLDYVTKYSYDLRNNVSSQVNNDGVKLVKEYNELNEVISLISHDTSIQNEYDKSGNLISTIENGDATSIKYNTYNDIVSYVDENGNEVKYTYDSYGNRTSIIYSDSSKVTYTYDDLNRLSSITDAQGQLTTYTYDEAGNRINESLPNNVEVRNEYDRNSRLTKREYVVNEVVMMSLVYTYDSNGRIISEEREEKSEEESEDDLKTTKKYTYDSIGQLTKAEYEIVSGEETEQIIYEYSYNKLLNREEVKVTRDGKTEYIKEVTNDIGQVLRREGDDFTTRYKYDEVGNIIEEKNEDGSYVRYSYNSLNQLVKLSSSTGYYETFEYDGLGNMMVE